MYLFSKDSLITNYKNIKGNPNVQNYCLESINTKNTNSDYLVKNLNPFTHSIGLQKSYKNECDTSRIHNKLNNYEIGSMFVNNLTYELMEYPKKRLKCVDINNILQKENQTYKNKSIAKNINNIFKKNNNHFFLTANGFNSKTKKKIIKELEYKKNVATNKIPYLIKIGDPKLKKDILYETDYAYRYRKEKINLIDLLKNHNRCDRRNFTPYKVPNYIQNRNSYNINNVKDIYPKVKEEKINFNYKS